MISIYFFKIQKKHHQRLEYFLSRVPILTKNTLQKYHRKEDQLRGVIARLILKKLLIERGFSENVLSHIKIDEFDRPFIEGNVDFNIAHSGTYVICAVSEKSRIGVDIEKIKKIKMDDFNVFLAKDELKKIKASKTPENIFFTLWTQKEAVSKANGKGLGVLLPDIKIKKGNAVCKKQKWNLLKLDIGKKYHSYLAFKGKQAVELKELKLAELG